MADPRLLKRHGRGDASRVGSSPPVPGRILVVDDDDLICRSYAAALTREGHDVVMAEDGRAAIQMVAGTQFDAILTDIAMPGLSGIDFLRVVRERDLNVPVVLMTGDPRLETAIRAVEYGAARYLVKPVGMKELTSVMARAVRLHQLARLKRQALVVTGAEGLQLGDRAALDARFSRALDSIWPAFQPIVSWGAQKAVAYEALMRSGEPTLARPPDVIDAAERLGRLHDLGRVMRHRTAVAASGLPAGALLFINLHPQDFTDDEIYASDTLLAGIAHRVIMEITERSSLDGLTDIRSRAADLRSIGYNLAVDDLGAGYAGLSSIVQLEPEVVKIDMSLIRGVDADISRQHVIRSLAQLSEDLGMQVICEGVETVLERDMLLGFGCDLQQGWLFGKAEQGFEAPRF